MAPNALKRAGFVASCGTTDDELATLAAVGGDCNRWLKYFYIEMRNGNQRVAQRWIESARRTAERDVIGRQQAADHYGKRWDMAAEYKQDKEAVMIYGSFTPPGFDEDRYDEADCEPLTAEQIAAMNEVWPQYAQPQQPHERRPDTTTNGAQFGGGR